MKGLLIEPNEPFQSHRNYNTTIEYIRVQHGIDLEICRWADIGINFTHGQLSPRLDLETQLLVIAVHNGFAYSTGVNNFLNVIPRLRQARIKTGIIGWSSFYTTNREPFPRTPTVVAGLQSSPNEFGFAIQRLRLLQAIPSHVPIRTEQASEPE